MKGKSSVTPRPNILIITTDQQRFDHLGLKGMSAIATPNLDRLGAEGVHFDRAYTVMPTCTPARVSLLNGQYPSRHGAWSIGVSVDPFPRPTIADILGEAGYETSYFGKTHFVRREDEERHVTGLDNPPDEFFRDFSGPYLGFQYVQVSKGHTINQKPDMHYRVFLEDKGVDYKTWFPRYGEDYDHHRCGSWEIPENCHDTAWVGQNTEKWIRERTGEKPWLCWASFQDPHEPFVCPEPWYSRVDADKMEPFEGVRDGEFDDKPAFYGEAAKGDWSRFDDGNGVPSAFLTPARDKRAHSALRATLGMVGFIDDRVGRMLTALEETGQADNTIVVFTTDHGEMHGHHGFWGKGLTAYDDCQRIPLLVWGPKHVKKIGTTGALANLVDLPRTLLTMAGFDIPVGMGGTDLSPVLRGKADSVQDHVFVECNATDKVFQTTMVTKRHKLVVYREGAEGELYDMAEDPDQYINLWNRSECAGLKAELLLRFAQGRMEGAGQQNPRLSFA